MDDRLNAAQKMYLYYFPGAKTVSKDEAKNWLRGLAGKEDRAILSKALELAHDKDGVPVFLTNNEKICLFFMTYSDGKDWQRENFTRANLRFESLKKRGWLDGDSPARFWVTFDGWLAFWNQ